MDEYSGCVYISCIFLSHENDKHKNKVKMLDKAKLLKDLNFMYGIYMAKASINWVVRL